MQLRKVTFHVFFKMDKLYPETGKRFGISDSLSSPPKKKTFWSRTMCVRVCHLWIAFYWAIGGENKPGVPDLGLGRIGTHAVECHCGRTRSALRGETRWPQFLSAQVNAAIAMNFMTELNLHPSLRRFNNTSGCAVDDSETGLIDIDFLGTIRVIDCIEHLLRRPSHELAFAGEMDLVLWFAELATKVKEVGDDEKTPRSTRVSGSSITSRLYFAPNMEQNRIENDPTFYDFLH
jgi:hypothetical protein